MIGKTISHYKIIEKIGSGGMGIVYKAKDTKLKRTVALKFLPQQFSIDEEAKKRFIHEAQASASLDHPNICNIHEINETKDNQLFIAMACYEGESLKDKMKKGSMQIAETFDIALQVAEGLKNAHKKDIVHRDIKPANLFLTHDGLVKILDFGLAKLKGVTKLTREGTTMGTIAYMSPEQAAGEDMDHRTDIWSLGALLYEMITDQLPFKGEYEQAVIYSILNEDPKPLANLRPEIPDGLEDIIFKTLAKEPQNRYQDITDLIADLQNISQGKKPAGKITSTIRLTTKKTKQIFRYTVISMVLISLVIAAILILKEKTTTSYSLAVLPFQNLSGDSNQEFFVNGMHESLLTELCKIKALRVISRTSVFQYQNTKKSIPEIAKELKVDWVVGGSAVQVGKTVRINAQLIDAKRDHNVWADKYDRQYKDILQLHSEVARDITIQIKGKLAPEEKQLLEKTGIVNPEAHKAYLKGRFFWNKYSPDDIKKSLDYFRQAIQLDPKYAPAYTGLFRANFDLAQTLLPPTDVEGIKKAKEEARVAAQKAMELDSNFSEAHTALACIRHYFDWDWAGAEESFEKALELNPNDVLTRMRYSDYLVALGSFDEAITQAQKAVELDPLSPAANWFLAVAFYHNREYDRSMEICKKNLEFNPNSVADLMILGWDMFLKGNIKEAMAWWAKMHEIYGNKELAKIFRESTWEEAAQAWLDQALSPSPPFFANPDTFAWVYAHLGKKEETFRWLEKGIKTRRGCIIYLNVDPCWDFLRSEPRFQDFVRMMDLPESKTFPKDKK
jgi:serine/threonine protein kinase